MFLVDVAQEIFKSPEQKIADHQRAIIKKVNKFLAPHLPHSTSKFDVEKLEHFMEKYKDSPYKDFLLNALLDLSEKLGEIFSSSGKKFVLENAIYICQKVALKGGDDNGSTQERAFDLFENLVKREPDVYRCIRYCEDGARRGSYYSRPFEMKAINLFTDIVESESDIEKCIGYYDYGASFGYSFYASLRNVALRGIEKSIPLLSQERQAPVFGGLSSMRQYSSLDKLGEGLGYSYERDGDGFTIQYKGKLFLSQPKRPSGSEWDDMNNTILHSACFT